MSSLAYPLTAAPRRGRRRPAAVLRAAGPDVLLGAALVALAVGLLVALPSAVGVDSWLELVAGRAVWQSGIPQHDLLTVMAHGRPWVDQQWLAQLAAYGLDRAGGLGLLGLVNVALIVVPVGALIAGARRLGAPLRSVLLALPLCLILVMATREVRTQEFAIPLFAAVVCLLSADSRAPSRRALWCLPILVLWANIHGSATLGAGLVALRGLTLGWERRSALRRGLGAWRRPVALVLGAPLAITVTPYGPAIVGYYRATMGSGTLRRFIGEWQPVTSLPVVAVALGLLLAATLWSFARAPTRTTTWEKLAFLVLCAGTVSVVRNMLFCGLLAVLVAPASWGWGSRAEGRRKAPGRGRALVNGAIAAAAATSLLAGAIGVLRAGDGAIADSAQPPGALAAVQAALRSDPSLRVLTDDRYGDWLLWRDRALAGRMAYDVRYELLTAGQVDGLAALYTRSGTDWARAAAGYRLLVLDRRDGAGAQAMASAPGSRVLFDDGRAVVILRTAAEARA